MVSEANFNGGKPVDFSDVCQHYLGPVGKWAAVICSLLAIVGAMFAYWILMTNFLYNDISFIVGKESSQAKINFLAEAVVSTFSTILTT